MKKERCRLCGGKLNDEHICRECGYDNSASFRNSQTGKSKFGFGYPVLLISAIISTIIAIGIVYAVMKDTGEYRYSQIIEPGIYQVGGYLPQGRYHVQPEDCEMTGLEVFQYVGGRFYTAASYLFDKDSAGKKNSIQFTEGYYFIVPPGTKRGFYTDSPNKHSLRRVATEHSEEYTVESYAKSGEDFEPGVYDICYTSAAGTPLTVYCTVMHPESGEEMGVISIAFSGQNDKEVFTGVPLPLGSEIRFSSIGTEIKLTAAEYTYPEFYDLTWGYKG